MAKTPEGVIQAYAQEQLKKRGCLVRKLSYEGRRGCPDLLVLVPERGHFAFHRPAVATGIIMPSHVVFLEIKKDEQTEPEPHQQREHERMRAVGADVRVIGSKVQIDELVKELWPCD